jgi:hypothetical protein
MKMESQLHDILMSRPTHLTPANTENLLQCTQS